MSRILILLNLSIVQLYRCYHTNQVNSLCRCPADFGTNGWGNITYEEKTEEWQMRMRQIQGAIIVASMFQLLVGYLGNEVMAVPYSVQIDKLLLELSHCMVCCVVLDVGEVCTFPKSQTAIWIP
jgi:hypothetical protein